MISNMTSDTLTQKTSAVPLLLWTLAQLRKWTAESELPDRMLCRTYAEHSYNHLAACPLHGKVSARALRRNSLVGGGAG
jgi:hypothetical protein